MIQQCRLWISIHALLAESDFGFWVFSAIFPTISIHALLAESDFPTTPSATILSDFYPRSPCGERPLLYRLSVCIIKISIHALLAESDNRFATDKECLDISIHALIEESDAEKKVNGEYIYEFLSTLSLRRATQRKRFLRADKANFYPRSPCGERQHLSF